MDVVAAIEQVGSESGRTRVPVVISDSGQLRWLKEIKFGDAVVVFEYCIILIEFGMVHGGDFLQNTMNGTNLRYNHLQVQSRCGFCVVGSMQLVTQITNNAQGISLWKMEQKKHGRVCIRIGNIQKHKIPWA